MRGQVPPTSRLPLSLHSPEHGNFSSGSVFLAGTMRSTFAGMSSDGTSSARFHKGRRRSTAHGNPDTESYTVEIPDDTTRLHERLGVGLVALAGWDFS